MGKLLKTQGFVPASIVTDNLPSYGAALSDIGMAPKSSQRSALALLDEVEAKLELRRENLTQLVEPKDNQHCHLRFTFATDRSLSASNTRPALMPPMLLWTSSAVPASSSPIRVFKRSSPFSMMALLKPSKKSGSPKSWVKVLLVVVVGDQNCLRTLVQLVVDLDPTRAPLDHFGFCVSGIWI